MLTDTTHKRIQDLIDLENFADEIGDNDDHPEELKYGHHYGLLVETGIPMAEYVIVHTPGDPLDPQEIIVFDTEEQVYDTWFNLKEEYAIWLEEAYSVEW